MQGPSPDELPEELQAACQAIWDRLVLSNTNPLTDPQAESFAKQSFGIELTMMEIFFGCSKTQQIRQNR
jgi:hypothetical protein